MKKSILSLVVMFAFMMTSCGQNEVAMADTSIVLDTFDSTNNTKPVAVKEFVAFTPEQKERAKEISKEKLNTKKLMFGSAVVFKNKKLYWNVTQSATTYTFVSNLDFSNVNFEKTRGINAKDYAKKHN